MYVCIYIEICIISNVFAFSIAPDVLYVIPYVRNEYIMVRFIFLLKNFAT